MNPRRTPRHHPSPAFSHENREGRRPRIVRSRPSAVISSDQTLIALAGELTRRGLKCPGDLSLISSCNTHLCPITYPALTAIDQNLGQLGQNAVDLLIDYLDNDTTLTAAASRNDFPCRLVVRDSTGEPK